MAKIVSSYGQKMQAISTVTNFNFKHPEKLGRKNKAKITRIYNEIGKNTGFPIKAFPGLKPDKVQRAMAEINPDFKFSKWIKNPFLHATDNENTSLRFRGKRPYLVNKVAGAKIEMFHFTDQELATQNFERLKPWLERYEKNPFVETRGKIVTKDGDIYSGKQNPNSINHYEDFVGYVKYLIANYGESMGKENNHYIGQWLKGFQVVMFKKRK